MAIQVYNTLTRRKEPFETVEPGKVRMYVCGPTVYDKAHIGHAMSAIVFDVVRRYLEYKGYQVDHVMNFTDVDDKIIRRSIEAGDDPFAIANRYIGEFKRHIAELGILPATNYPQVSETIDEIVEMVQGLQESRYAYTMDGDVYFRVRHDDDYGKLSRRKLDEAMAGTRVESDETKEDVNDFALWKSQKPGEPAWPSPWGPGRPGWHIECSAMALKHLGEEIDIHGGGNDLVFPHHENEIAQTESYTGRPFARFWMHNGMLQLKGEKMSKSLGNLVTIDDFLAQHEASVLRLLILSSHYRKPLAYNDTVVEDNARALARLRGALRPAVGAITSGGAVDSLLAAAEQTRRGFEEAMDDDFNTAGALGCLFELVTEINRARDAGVAAEPLAAAQDVLAELAGILGLQLSSEATGAEAAPFIDLLLEMRSKLRAAKQFALADEIRNRLTDLGVMVEDTREGSTWRIQ
ncbi:MAG: cysteine--tRNA ligase [Anaerolineae bacterium]|nr:cysteine--tRNA ligase [Anaerolineae bacterium]MCB0243759.1 cysteine--tRNA ligase [Anaerolineae bacterium]MCB0247367.1 cysteine--tRNA ligase [Anaerolineae bacterium]MCB9143582.1 cysteine--tRNA ligase [Anaerolineales bacterium]MCO5243148.1 cysteine--tRNA ligase [Anaerolineae bacterium]